VLWHPTGAGPVNFLCHYWQSSMRWHDCGCSCWCRGLRPASLWSDRAQRALVAAAPRDCAEITRPPGSGPGTVVGSEQSRRQGNAPHARGFVVARVVKPTRTVSVHTQGAAGSIPAVSTGDPTVAWLVKGCQSAARPSQSRTRG